MDNRIGSFKVAVGPIQVMMLTTPKLLDLPHGLLVKATTVILLPKPAGAIGRYRQRNTNNCGGKRLKKGRGYGQHC
ncbi:hypothetical protein XANCAGTX0491_008029 [Xanthoria calcicola]